MTLVVYTFINYLDVLDFILSSSKRQVHPGRYTMIVNFGGILEPGLVKCHSRLQKSQAGWKRILGTQLVTLPRIENVVWCHLHFSMTIDWSFPGPERLHPVHCIQSERQRHCQKSTSFWLKYQSLTWKNTGSAKATTLKLRGWEETPMRRKALNHSSMQLSLSTCHSPHVDTRCNEVMVLPKNSRLMQS